MKKKIKICFLIFIFLFSQIGTPFFVNAKSDNPEKTKCSANASICLQTPESLNLYLNFQKEIIALINEDPFQTITEQIDIGEGGIFTNKLLKLSNTDAITNLPIITDLLKELETSITNILIGTTTSAGLFLLSTISIGKDALMSFSVLFQERPIVRDRAKLLDIERKISQTAYILGQKGKIGKKIKDTSSINKIIQKYKTLGLLGERSIIAGKLSYLEILLELIIINSNFKFFLSNGSTYELTENNSTINFAQNWTQKLKKEYQCARFTLGFRCNPPGFSMIANLKTLASNTQKTSKSAGNTIKKATEKLEDSIKGFKNFRSKKVKNLTSDELELLRAVYGIDTNNLSDEQLSFISPFAISQQTKNQYQEALKKTNNLSKMPKGLYQLIKEPISTIITQYKQTASQHIEKEKDKIQDKANEILSEKEKRAEEKELESLIKESYELQNKNKESIQLHNEMFNSLQILINSEINIKEETELSNTLLTTNQFAILSEKIQQIKEIIGNKKNGVRKSLNSICRYQCNNYQSTTCYIH